ncbi:unnamed protein product [Prunus brigantina]
MFWGRSKRGALAYIREKVLKKIEGWKQCILSLAGKEVLIKAIATAVPTYPMMCFLFPKATCSDICSDLAKFWWGKPDSDSKIHWKSWKALSLAKSEGGLGFRDLFDFNLALLAKQSWRILNNPHALWVKLLKARYFPDCDFKDATLGHRPSWIWRSLLAGRDTVMNNARRQIMNGESTNIWADNWVPEVGIITPLVPIPINAPQLVSEIIDVRSGSWNLDSVASYLSWETKRRILAIPVGASRHHDRVIWPWTSNGLYSVRSGYHVLHSTHRALAMGNSHSSHIIPIQFTEIRRVPSDDVVANNILNVLPASWNAPSGDFVKINVDGGWIGDTLKGGVGVVIRNTDGQFVGGLAGPICCDSALAAEAHSAIKGLALSANLGFRDVIVETDSKLLINGINGDFRNKVWSIMPLLEELHRICGSMHEVRWSWVHRDLNRAAHEAAMIGVRAMELESWVSRPPLSLVQVLVSDGLPCPP